VTRASLALWLPFAAMAQLQKLVPPPPAPAALPTGHGVIEGTVVDAATHDPLRKCKVTLGGSRQTEPTVVTDASGRFLFRELPAGTYWLNGAKSGYNQAQSSLSADPNVQITLGTDETKKGVEVALVPGGSISGRILNEDGVAVRNCSVTAVQPGYEQGNRTLVIKAGGMGTSDKGEYRISDLPPGRYYLFARCGGELPAPHPLLPRGDPRTPHEGYAPQFYGGGLDPSTATKLAVGAGANLEGIDFEVRRTHAFTLRGTVAGTDPEGPSDAMVMLQPANPLMRNLMQLPSSIDPRSRAFQIHGVMPGPYRLIALSGGGGAHEAYAQRTIEIGAAPPEPVDLVLSTGVELKGSVQFDTDEHPSPQNAQIFLMPVRPDHFQPQPHAEVNKDGTFTLTGAMPGHWRLTLNTSGYVKSLSLGGQQVSPYDFQIAAGATGPLQVTVGGKTADISIAVTGLSAGGQASVLVFPEDLDRLGSGLERMGIGGSQVGVAGLPPGRYRVLATDAPNPWILQQRPDLLKALERSTQPLDVPEGGRVSVTVELVSREELLRLLADEEL